MTPRTRYLSGGPLRSRATMRQMSVPAIDAAPAPALKISVLRRFMSFHGRAQRQDYWIIQLFLNALLVGLSLCWLSIVEAVFDGNAGSALVLFSPLYLFILWALIALQVRRLHDLNLSGFWVLLPVPLALVEGIVAAGSPTKPVLLIATMLLALTLILDGTRGPNKFGADPKGRPAVEDAKPARFPTLFRGFDQSAAAVVVAAAFLLATGSWLLGPASALIPSGLTTRIGNTFAAQRIPPYWRCSAPAAERVLSRLAARLAPGVPAKIIYTTYPGADGLALPGGRIIVGQSAVRAAAGPQELAGLLAHELAHSKLHHPERLLISSVTLSLLPNGLAGSYGLMTYGWALPYSRALEDEADALAARLMLNAGLAPTHLGKIIDRIERARRGRRKASTNGSAAWLSTHPTTPDRIRKLMRYAAPLAEQPAMSDADWSLVRKGCEA